MGNDALSLVDQNRAMVVCVAALTQQGIMARQNQVCVCLCVCLCVSVCVFVCVCVGLSLRI